MSDFEWETNANEVAASLGAVSTLAGARAYVVTRHHGQLLLTNVKRRAALPRSGPPGPRLITGDYNRSWNLQVIVLGDTIIATVGTNRPQGPRLEHGFVGRDSLGRNYHQPPYPHARPALFETEPLFIAAMATVAT